MLKDVPIGSPLFHLYNVLYLTFFTGVMAFGMLSVFYLTYEPPDPLKAVEKMLGETEQYNIIQKNIELSDLDSLHEDDQKKLKKYFNGTEIERFYVTDVVTEEPVMTVVLVASGGFGGSVKSLVGTDGEMVKAISVIDVSTETPGLGQRVSERKFQNQFIGRTRETIPIDRTEWEPKDIDMISGASFSSGSIVNNIVKAFDLYIVEGGV
ncbi:MAG: FMN-binding protein [Brevinema sp.]